MPRHKEAPNIKVIVSFEDTFRAYRGALSAAIRILRPDVEVKTVELDELGEMVGLPRQVDVYKPLALVPRPIPLRGHRPCPIPSRAPSPRPLATAARV